MMSSTDTTGRRPKDAELVQQFNRDRSIFEELLIMLSTNSAPEITSADSNLWTLEQYRNYKALLKRAHVKMPYWERDSLHFQVFAGKEVEKGLRITVAWRGSPPDNVVSNLADFKKSSQGWDHAYRPLGDGWYLYQGY
jgi:hypothetical protein